MRLDSLHLRRVSGQLVRLAVSRQSWTGPSSGPGGPPLTPHCSTWSAGPARCSCPCPARPPGRGGRRRPQGCCGEALTLTTPSSRSWQLALRQQSRDRESEARGGFHQQHLKTQCSQFYGLTTFCWPVFYKNIFFLLWNTFQNPEKKQKKIWAFYLFIKCIHIYLLSNSSFPFNAVL